MRHSISILIVCIFVPALFIGCSGQVKKEKGTTILHDICRKNNLFDIYDKEKLSFTFNARLPKKTVSRNWVWDIKGNRVFLSNVLQDGMTAEFINDIYWLLFPLKAYESAGQVEVSLNPAGRSPMADVPCTEVTIKYMSGMGYTPNDTYKLYVKNGTDIIEWAYLKEGLEPPRRVTTWTDYQTIAGIELSLSRKGRGGFKVWFTDVEIQ